MLTNLSLVYSWRLQYALREQSLLSAQRFVFVLQDGLQCQCQCRGPRLDLHGTRDGSQSRAEGRACFQCRAGEAWLKRIQPNTEMPFSSQPQGEVGRGQVCGCSQGEDERSLCVQWVGKAER